MSCILISDCGATTCQSALLETSSGKQIKMSTTSGYNPHASVQADFPKLGFEKEDIQEVYFFVSGYKSTFHESIHKQLSLQYPAAKIKIYSDLKAAALSLSPHEPSFIHVIGTGSAVNFWDGTSFTNPKINLGYLWEDYASGYDIGKSITRLWAEGKLTDEENRIVTDQLGSVDTFVQKVYKGNSKQLLAQASPIINSLSKFTKEKIINERLELYFSKNIDIFASTSKHHFTGSIAFAFREIITSKMMKRDVYLGAIQKDSMEGLISYFQHKIAKS